MLKTASMLARTSRILELICNDLQEAEGRWEWRCLQRSPARGSSADPTE